VYLLHHLQVMYSLNLLISSTITLRNTVLFKPGTHFAFLLLALVFVTGLLTVVFVQIPGNTLIWREIQNSGHTILFVIITLAFMVMIRPAAATLDSLYGKYLIAVALLVSAAVLTELGQMLTHREPSLVDIVRNASGVLIGLGMYAFFDSGLTTLWGRRWRVGRIGILVYTALFLVLSLTPLLKLSYAYQQRNQAFPLISDFQSGWARQFIRLDQSVMTPISATYGKAAGVKHSVSQLELKPGLYPGISIREPFPDWSAYTYLTLVLHSPEADAFDMVLRIHDSQHNNDFYDRFNQVLAVTPGINRFQIPLLRVAQAPQNRMMDMERISGVMLFVSGLDKSLKIHPGTLRLE
jgi:hypothetical protein